MGFAVQFNHFGITAKIKEMSEFISITSMFKCVTPWPAPSLTFW